MKKQNIKLIPLAKKLRRDQTDAERRLWHIICGKQFHNLKFRRQVPLGPYIVDFICYEKKLIIECDGSQHLSELNKDQIRDRWLQTEGFKVLRFLNNDILTNSEGVYEILLETCFGQHPPLSSPPLKGGDKKNKLLGSPLSLEAERT